MPPAQIANASSVFNPLQDAVEIISDRLFYASYGSHPSTFPKPQAKSSSGKPIRPIHYFCVDNELVYWNFFLDFGPLNLGQLYRFCAKLNYKLHKDKTLSHKHICFFSGASENKRANAVFLICAYQVLYLNRKPEEALQMLKSQIKTLPPFHDASPGRCTYRLKVVDCIRGLVRAKKFGFFDFDKFDAQEYEHFEQVENGDLNWIIRGKILAFAGPQNRRQLQREGYYTLTPESYIPYFQQNKVGLVVRLNKRVYDEERFREAGIEHFEKYYLDGSCPPMHILQEILVAFESVPKTRGFAVHCKAGLGRTGTCIGAYMMKHYKFTAAEAIGWMRICRPGMVIGPQQHFLQDIQEQMWHEGDIMRLTPQKSLPPASYYSEPSSSKDERHKKSGASFLLSSLPFSSLSVDDRRERQYGRPGQANELLARRLASDARAAVNV